MLSPEGSPGGDAPELPSPTDEASAGCPFTLVMKALAERDAKNRPVLEDDFRDLLPSPNPNEIAGWGAMPEKQFSRRKGPAEPLQNTMNENATLSDIVHDGLGHPPPGIHLSRGRRNSGSPLASLRRNSGSPLASLRETEVLQCPFSGRQSEKKVVAGSQKPAVPNDGTGSCSSGPANASPRHSSSGSKRRVAASRASRNTLGRGTVGGMTSTAGTRRKRAGPRAVFSSWESATYGPVIRENWTAALAQRSIAEIGCVFYDELFRAMPEIQHMFTAGRHTQAAKFAEMLHAVVASVDCEADLYTKLRALAPMHVEKGVNIEHMPRMGNVLIAVLETVLGDAFDRAAHVAWRWLWAWLSKVMQQTLEEVRFGQNAVIRSWNIAQDNFPDHQVGEVFFNTIFQLAPNLRSVFHKPKQILACKFVEMLSTLVSFSGDKDRMTEQIQWLGIRHLAYGAEPEHAKVLGQVVVRTMEKCVGDDWTEEMCAEWLELWDDVCKALFVVMRDAERYGSTLDNIWQIVENHTNEGNFGATLKRELLSGTEWVAGLNKKMKETDAEPKQRLQSAATPSLADAVSPRGKVVSPRGKAGGKAGVSVPPLSLPGSGSREPSVAGEGPGAQAKSVSGGGDAHSEAPSGASAGGAPPSSTLLRRFLSAPSSHSFARQGRRHEAEEEWVAPSKGASDCDAIGHHFWDFVGQGIRLLWQPEQQHEAIIVRAHSMFKWGIRSAQLETIGEALAKAMAHYVTEAGAEWGEREAESWQWFWGMAEASLRRTLDVCERGDSATVQESWALAKTLVAPEELGESIFQNLARIAPYIVPLFRRPKRIQSSQFIEAVDMLIAFSVDPAEFFRAFQELVIRHIKYGVKSEYAKPFGQAILLGVKNALGDHWTQRVADAWNDLWLRVSSCITRALNVGTNILVVALVQGDVEQLEQAARCAPRMDRHHWMTRVDVNGQVLSPIAWAIRDGKFNLVEFMLNDLLAIRADRETYYYGREELFAAHPEIVELLCRECAFLVERLLDGLLWHSQFVAFDGTVRVNYYLENIYGDPGKYPDAWTSPLAVLVLHRDPEIFLHPVVSKVVHLKWTGFCRNAFLLMQAWYIVMLILLMVGNVFHVGNCTYQPARIALAATAGLTGLVQTGFMCMQIAKRQTHRITIWHTFSIPLPVWLCSSWNVQRYVSCLLIPFAALLEPCHLQPRTDFHPVALADCDSLTVLGRAFSALTAMLLWTQALQLFVVSTRLAALSWSLGMMFQDVSRNLVVVAVFILAWASGLTALQETNFEYFDLGLVNLCRKVLNLSPPNSEDMHPISAVFLFTFAIANIGMVAILIAQIKASYDVVAKHKHGIALQHRAHICIDVESVFPLSYRQKLFARLKFDEPIPFDQGDLGPPGGLQVREPSAVRKHVKYIPDRIVRYTGNSTPSDPWEMDEDIEPLDEDEEGMEGVI